MPLLKRGTEIFPQSLFELPGPTFPGGSPMSAVGRRRFWRATSPPSRFLSTCRCGKTRGCRGGGVSASYMPLFPGYLFFRGSAAQRVAVLQSNVVARLIEVPDQELLTRELRELRGFQEADATLTPYVPIAPGSTVRVVEGPFSGYTGKLVREQSRLRLIVSISMLRQSVAVEFSREALSPVAPLQSVNPSRSSRGVLDVRWVGASENKADLFRCRYTERGEA